MKNNKIFIAGSGGMLGEAFQKIFSKDYELLCTDIDLNENWLSYLDFRNSKDYFKMVSEFDPSWLFHIGAFTDLEYCEKNEDSTYDTNTESVKHAVKISNHLNIPLLYISTAGIFDGKKEFYDESDEPNPIGHYARSKYLGEKYVLEHSPNNLICRAGWMMGGGPKKDKKFIQKILKQIKAGAKELYIVNDKLGTPTYTHDFANNVKELIENNHRGLYNMVCEGLTGRLEVAREVVKVLSLEDQITINEVNSDYFADSYFAERPDNERLINKNLNDIMMNKMSNWKDALKIYLNSYYSDYL